MKTDNELIAEFDGAEFINDAPDVYPDGYYMWLDKERVSLPLCSDDFQYDTSWDWLIPVVEKIEGLDDNGGFFDCHFQILRNGSFVIDRCGETVIEIYGNDKLKATYKAVIQFIKWYNENTIKQNES